MTFKGESGVCVKRTVRLHLISSAIISIALAIVFPAFAEDVPKPPTTLASAEKLLAKGALAEAARAYGEFAHDFSKDPRAPRAFADAAVMNMRLGTLDALGADANLRHFENTFVLANLDIWADMTFTMIDGFTMRENRETTMALLHRTITVVDQFAVDARKKKTNDWQTLREIELRIHGRLARVYTEMGDHRGAEMEHARIQKLSSELGVWPGKKPPRTTAKHLESIDFIAETLFYAAEQKRFNAERIRLPAYLGAGDRESVQHFITESGTRWFENRQFAVEDALRSYAFMFGVELPKPIPPKPPPPLSSSGTIGLVGGDPVAPWGSTNIDPTSPNYEGPPFPSPRWAIAAAERIGRSWSDFVIELRKMPIPRTWGGGYPRMAPVMFLSIIDPPSEIVKIRAKHAYKMCFDLSMKHQIVNEHTRACIDWLAQNYRAEYKEIDDFAPPGGFFALGLVHRPAPLPRFTHQ